VSDRIGTVVAAPTASASSHARRLLLASILLVLASFGIRAVVFERARPIELVGDEVYYAETALEIARGHGLHSPRLGTRAAWPPAQSFLLAIFSNPATPVDAARLQWAAVAVGSLLPLLIMALARALFDARTGWIAAAIAALYPEFVSYAHYLWAETLFAVFATAGLTVGVWARRGSAWLAVAAGVLFGLAALTRETGLLLGACCGLWWLLASEARATAAARMALLIAAMLAVVAPWSLRNQNVLDRFVPIATVGWMGAAEGNLLGADWRRVAPNDLARFRAQYFSIRDEVQRMDWARATALQAIADAQPWWIAKKIARNLPLLLAPDSFALKKLTRENYGDVSLGWRRAIFAATALSYLTISGLALIGIASLADARRWLPIFCAVTVLGVHVIANASSRYRFPLMPLAIVYAAHALARGRNALRDAGPLGLGIAAAGFLVLVASAVAFAPEAASFWSTGRYLDTMRP
jgi:4-amino-4-deoxy-L-arabinose transferase-like glycosyltransferase